MEGLFQQLRVINPGHPSQAYAWAMLDQQAREALNQLKQAYFHTDSIRVESALIAFQEKMAYAVMLLS